MKRFAAICLMLAVALASAVSAGCWPRQLVVWSPDARRAVVMDSNSTSLCDGDGKLARLDVGAARAAAWMPDSKSVLLVMRASADNWAELAKALDQPTRQAVIAAGGDLEKAILALPGNAELTDDDVQPIVKRVFKGRGSLLAAALVYLRDARPDDLRKRLAERWKEMDKLSVNYSQLRLFDLNGMSLKPAAVILNSLKDVHVLRLAPDGEAVAYVTGSDRTQNGYTLWLAPMTADAAPRELADRVALFPDWSTDGRHVAYVQSAGAKDAKPVSLAALSKRQVADGKGKLLDEMPEPEPLAAVVFDNLLGVRCLADGRILFASADMTLPAAVEKMHKPISLFTFNPGDPTKVTRVIGAQSQSQLPESFVFELSPDHKQISLAGNDAKVCVAALADGRITWVQQQEGQLRMLPSWRSAGELCFMIPAGGDDPHSRGEVALWSAGKTRILSKDWPDDVLENLTFSPSQKQPPATAPATRAKQGDKGL